MIRATLALMAALIGSSAVTADRPHVLVIVADDLRWDCVRALGENRQVETPHLDRLVAAGTTFPNATCGNPLCVPSRAEIISGRTAFRNGFYESKKLDTAGPPTWAEAMTAGGYRTVYVGKWHTSGRPTARGYTEVAGLYGSGGGRPLSHPTDHAGRPVTGYVGWAFQSADGRTKYTDKGIGLTPTTSREIADAAIGVLTPKPAKPLFVHVNFTAPHDPRHIPPGYADKYPPNATALPKNFLTEHPFDHGNLKGRDEVLLAYPRRPDEVKAELAAYYAVVSDLDAQVGRILVALEKAGLAGNTLVVFTADHGLAVGSHGLIGKQNMYEHTIRVPLIFRGPGIARGETRDAGCYLRDLYPTVCDYADVPVPDGLDGKSLVPILKDASASVYPFVVGYFADSQRMIRDGRWKYIAYPEAGREQLFDLAADPLELTDRSADPKQAGRKRVFRNKLRAWLTDQGDAVATKLSGYSDQ